MTAQESGEWQRTAKSRTWREKLFDFVLQQGIATVLLFAMACGGAYATMYGVPWFIERIEARLQYINESHEKRLSMVIAEQAEDRKLYREDREIWREEQEKLRTVINGLLQELRALQK